MTTRGRFVVLEGADGSGKGTQLQLLAVYFKQYKIPHAIFDFPQYYKTFFGRFIGKFLKGEFGKVEDVHPYLLVFAYAADRWKAKDDIEEALNAEKIVVSNRYTGSAAYQAAKLPSKERKSFTDWSFEMEYDAFGIPREDLVIFLYVPFAVSQKLLEEKSARKYMGNSRKKDIHEANVALMQEVEKVYLEYCERLKYWVKIDCVKKGQILPREEIHRKIIDVLKRKKII